MNRIKVQMTTTPPKIISNKKAINLVSRAIIVLAISPVRVAINLVTNNVRVAISSAKAAISPVISSVTRSNRLPVSKT